MSVLTIILIISPMLKTIWHILIFANNYDVTSAGDDLEPGLSRGGD